MRDYDSKDCVDPKQQNWPFVGIIFKEIYRVNERSIEFPKNIFMNFELCYLKNFEILKIFEYYKQKECMKFPVVSGP